MAALETCPRCGGHFPAEQAWDSVPALVALYGLAGLSRRVKCPGCGHVFEAEEVRFLGLLSPRGLRLGIAVLIAAVVLIGAVGVLLQ